MPLTMALRERSASRRHKLPPADRAFFRDSERNDFHQLYLMCDDLDAEIERLAGRGIACDDAKTASWGRFTGVPLPGGGTIGLYEARHNRP